MPTVKTCECVLWLLLCNSLSDLTVSYLKLQTAPLLNVSHVQASQGKPATVVKSKTIAFWLFYDMILSCKNHRRHRRHESAFVYESKASLPGSIPKLNMLMVQTTYRLVGLNKP